MLVSTLLGLLKVLNFVYFFLMRIKSLKILTHLSKGV